MGSPRHPASLNQTKISEDAKWDGFYAVETSDLSLDAEEITGHLVWSFIALVMERGIELTLKSCGEKEVTHRNIREAIATMETAQLRALLHK